MSAPAIAVRIVNQYRKRDIYAYLALRYFLESTAARKERWIREVCTTLTSSTFRSGYLGLKHFKEISDTGHVMHRDIYIPGPVEALAEATLIDTCHAIGGPFIPVKSVYSYLPPDTDDKSGIFRNYMDGLRNRHRDISDACRQRDSLRVAFYDLKKFYPSINIEMASQIWRISCADAGVPDAMTRLGNELLDRHGAESGGSILTGPMFSHLIGNLLLRKIDQKMADGQVRYFRYVDDIALVGKPDEIDRAYAALKAETDALGLTLHEPNSAKSINIGADDWLQGEHDYLGREEPVSWKTLIGGIKSLLLWRPDTAEELHRKLEDHQIRLPLPEYASSIREHDYLARTSYFLRKKYWRFKTRSTTVDSLVAQALYLRQQLDHELSNILVELESPSPFHVRRYVPKARYRLGRLAYLATPERLTEIAERACHPALRFHSEVCKAIGTRQVTDLFALGSNAVQAAAQVLRTDPRPVNLGSITWTEASYQSLATAYLNGLTINAHEPVPARVNDLVDFAIRGPDMKMMEGDLSFLSEVACLHGLSEVPRHQSILDSAFDEDEDLALDVIEQARSSLSG